MSQIVDASSNDAYSPDMIEVVEEECCGEGSRLGAFSACVAHPFISARPGVGAMGRVTSVWREYGRYAELLIHQQRSRGAIDHYRGLLFCGVKLLLMIS